MLLEIEAEREHGGSKLDRSDWPWPLWQVTPSMVVVGALDELVEMAATARPLNWLETFPPRLRLLKNAGRESDGVPYVPALQATP